MKILDFVANAWRKLGQPEGTFSPLHAANVIANNRVKVILRDDRRSIQTDVQTLKDLAGALSLALAGSPSDSSLYAARAAVHQLLADEPSFYADVKEAIRRDPKNQEARRMLFHRKNWDNLFFCPPWTPEAKWLHPILQSDFLSGNILQIVRYDFKPCLAVIVRGEVLKDPSALKTARWDAFLSRTPYGNIAAHYTIFESRDPKPMITEGLLFAAPASRDQIAFNPLIIRLAYLKDAFIIVIDSTGRVIENLRYHIPRALRKRLREISTGLLNEGAFPTQSHLEDACRWHLDHFSLADAGKLHEATPHKTQVTGATPMHLCVGSQRIRFEQRLKFYFSLDDRSEEGFGKNVLIIQEPHYFPGQQWRLFKGLRHILDQIDCSSSRVVLLAEGYESLKHLTIDPLVDACPSPSDLVVHRVLKSFLIPGYIACEWKHRFGVAILGSEDMKLYRLSAKLWELEMLEAWQATVPGRNLKIAETIIQCCNEYDLVIAFVGGMHLHKISEDIYEWSMDHLYKFMQSEGAERVRLPGNWGIIDYLSKAGIDYTYISVREDLVSSDTDSDFRLYQKLFNYQRRDKLDEYVKEILELRGVTVSPSVQAAADLAAQLNQESSSSDADKNNARKRTGDAKRREKRNVDKVAKKYKIDRHGFGEHIEAWKDANSLPNDYLCSNAELNELAEDFKRFEGM